MRGKVSSKRKKNYGQDSARKNLKLNGKNIFIRRSKQMEELRGKERRVESYVAPSDMLENTVNELPSTMEFKFYDQLIEGYTQLKTVPNIKVKPHNSEEHKTFQRNEDNEKETEQQPGNIEKSDLYNSFTRHFNVDVGVENVEDIISKETKSIQQKWRELGVLKIDIPVLDESHMSNYDYKQPTKILKLEDLAHLNIQQPLNRNTPFPLSQLQSELLHILSTYQDVYYPNRSHYNADEIRQIYSVHALNHILISRSLVLHNNKNVVALAKSLKLPTTEISIPDNCRDQGLKRTRVLIIVPFRESALRIVNQMIQLLYGDDTDKNKKNGTIIKYQRFIDDFTGNLMHFPKTNPKPLDYEQTFSGNIDDNFKVGIRFTKKSMSLFSDMNSSDMLIASPVALRMVINDKDQDVDFLNSIELLIIDQADIYYAQNWENLLFMFDHLHQQPHTFPDTNCQRVRTWCLNGLSRFYRQTLLFSSHDLPEFRAVLSTKCLNYQGKVRITNAIEHGDIRNVMTSVQQVFQRINCSDVDSAFDARFQYFVATLLPDLSSMNHSHCMIYVPSYFDYVRLRNHLKKEMINFVQINEYSKKEKIARARDFFFHGGAPILLYSERAHFYRRTRIKGIRHLIMYKPPNWPNFYSELLNLMVESNQNSRDGLQDALRVTILYTKYDLIVLSNILGSENAIKLTTEKNDLYLFST